MKVYRPLKGADARYFAVGTNRDEPQGFRPVGDGDTPEAALQACLEGAGVYHAGRASERVRLDGSCQCGKVRFRVESDTPYPFMFCYCSICRKTTGGPCGCNIMGRRETLRITGKRFECQAAH